VTSMLFNTSSNNNGDPALLHEFGSYWLRNSLELTFWVTWHFYYPPYPVDFLLANATLCPVTGVVHVSVTTSSKLGLALVRTRFMAADNSPGFVTLSASKPKPLATALKLMSAKSLP